MLETPIFLSLVTLVLFAIVFYPRFIAWRRERIRCRPFPDRWRSIVERNVPLYSRFPRLRREQLQGHIQVFLAEKQFIPCGGLTVNEEMRVTVAAIACLLLPDGGGDYFSRLRSILLYPTAYLATEMNPLGNYGIEERRVVRLGESWTRDQLVLSWQQVQQDIHNWEDGHNVVLHEFAHQLDAEDGAVQGVPLLPKDIDPDHWSKVMTEEYEKLCRSSERGMKTEIDPYGATNPAEFFAVVTETFFENPRSLRARHPALYELLQQYYRLDPARRDNW
ncbi:M90 family metallopeptidase [Pannus brasiliensis CCIBt3594]|uniref:M90 family metallopeptidase n=1 Tax=Pannus brasiliensis CCIBt3594 TaxID=1427578 RepID=A0AAW9QYB3_9CHRO